ncbi:hypothetical protein DFH09DRAFT_1397963 [Mycena vulgaris]|nr:hypothetical protein DFH09DRAFT_1397963 [Mycena vulgaris]
MFTKIWSASPRPSRARSLSNHCIALTPQPHPGARRLSSLSPSVNTPSSVTSGGKTTITWSSTSSDPIFSVELVHPSFNNAFVTASSHHQRAHADHPVRACRGRLHVNVSDINQVYATSRSFAIGAEASSSDSTTSTPTASGNSGASATGGAGGTGSASVNRMASSTGSESGSGSARPTTAPSSPGSAFASASAPLARHT